MREKWIAAAPYVEMPPKPPPRERWLTREEVQRLIHSAKSLHIRLFIVLAYYTTARTGAILDLTWDRVDLERRLIYYAKPGRRETKKRGGGADKHTGSYGATGGSAGGDLGLCHRVPRSERACD